MARNRNRKQQRQSLHSTEEETTSVRRSTWRGMQPDEPPSQLPRPKQRATFPTGAPLAGSDVLQAIGKHGTVGRAMHDVIHTPDDEKVVTRLGPEQAASVSFHPDRALGDAGAEFAEEFGRDFLLAATTGEAFGEVESAATEDVTELGDSFLHVTDELEDLTAYAEPADDDTPPSKH
jgi:hypothetical protein